MQQKTSRNEIYGEGRGQNPNIFGVWGNFLAVIFV
jgi:hypothetical protein